MMSLEMSSPLPSYSQTLLSSSESSSIEINCQGSDSSTISSYEDSNEDADNGDNIIEMASVSSNDSNQNYNGDADDDLDIIDPLEAMPENSSFEVHIIWEL